MRRPRPRSIANPVIREPLRGEGRKSHPGRVCWPYVCHLRAPETPPAAGRGGPARRQPQLPCGGNNLKTLTARLKESVSLIIIIPPQPPPPQSFFFSFSGSSGTQRHPQIPGKRFPRPLPSRSLGWPSRWPESARPAQPDSAPGHPRWPPSPQGDRPLAYPRAQRGSHGGRAAAPGARRGQRSAERGLRAAPWPGAGLPPRPGCRGRSWPAPLRAGGG